MAKWVKTLEAAAQLGWLQRPGWIPGLDPRNFHPLGMQPFKKIFFDE